MVVIRRRCTSLPDTTASPWLNIYFRLVTYSPYFPFSCLFHVIRIPTYQFSVATNLLQNGADVHAKDKGGLVPLHNACSYGHYEVTELLVKHGACVNVADLW